MTRQQGPSKSSRAARYPFRIAKHVYKLPRTVTDLAEELAGLRHTADELSKKIGLLREEDAHLRNKAEVGERYQEEVQHRLEQLDRRLSDLLHRVTIINESKAGPPSTPAATAGDLVADDHLLDSFYVEFERWFRGTAQEITERQRVYLPYFTKSAIDSHKYPVVDIGCGRGEFILTLKKNGIRGIGLDINKAMVEQTKQRGLEAVEGDALSYLRAQKTNSLLAVTGFHVVEHIPFLDLIRIFDECYRALQPGGFVIFETPNPENLIVGSCNFYADPSHLHPLPPAFLDFALKTRGFNKTEIKRLHPTKKHIQAKDPLVKEMAERLYGPQDYSIIATK